MSMGIGVGLRTDEEEKTYFVCMVFKMFEREYFSISK